MKISKNISILTIFILISCSNHHDELNYYKKIGGIQLPDHTEIIEHFDNGEFITTSIIKIPKNEIPNFIKRNSFKKVSNDNKVYFMGMSYLKKENLNFPKNEYLYEKIGRSQNNTWYFLIDDKNGYVWMEIQYPDFGGTKP